MLRQETLLLYLGSIDFRDRYWIDLKDITNTYRVLSRCLSGDMYTSSKLMPFSSGTIRTGLNPAETLVFHGLQRLSCPK
jgi:hypothetical protein